MSGCVRCWETPCACGHEWELYLKWTQKDKKALIKYLESTIHARTSDEDSLLDGTTSADRG